MKQLKKSLQLAAAGILVVASILPTLSGSVSAAQITARKVTIGSSVASAQTTYVFTFTVPSNTPIQSMSFTPCTTASGTCTAVSGFTGVGSTLTSQPTGVGAASGWTANSNATSLRILNAANSTAPSGSQTVSFSTVTNPTATNSTFFIRIASFSDSAWTTGIDTGVVAASTAGVVTVTASVDETLTFTLGTSNVNLGTLSSSTTGSGTSTMTASTNAATGYSITVNGSSLTGSNGSITGNSTAKVSTAGQSEFGLNLVANTSPTTVGSAVGGAGSGVADTGYNTANTYKFASGDSVARASAPTNANTFTVTYIANIPALLPAGTYSTNLNYIATANF